MTRLKPLSELTLIALALLLSAANASALPRSHQTKKSHSQTEQKDSSSSPVSTHSYQASPEPTAQPNSQSTYNYNYYPVPESPPIWFQVFTSLVLLGFTGGLWWTSVQQWRAALATLEIPNRAHLNIEGFEPNPLSVTFTLRNAGHVAATEVRISWVRQSPSVDLESIYVAPQSRLHGEVYGPGEVTEHQLYFFEPNFEGATTLLSEADIDQLKSGKTRFDLFMVVSYNDGFGKARISWQKLSYDRDKERWIPMGARHD